VYSKSIGGCLNNNFCVVYHWWNDSSVTPLFDKGNPVLLSAASVRLHNPYIPIYIIDTSSHERTMSDWGVTASQIRVKIIKRNPHLYHALPYTAHAVYDLRLLSRVFDVEIAMRAVDEDNVIFMDSDIFCLKPLIPLRSVKTQLIEHFYSNANNGVWIYNKKSRSCSDVFDGWKNLICRSILDPESKFNIHQMNPHYGSPRLNDEVVYRTLCALYPGDMRPTDFTENYLMHWLSIDPKNITSNIKLLHCLGFLTTTNRAVLIKLFRELWPLACRWIDEDQRKLLFGEVDESKQMSIGDLYLNKPALRRMKEELGFTKYHENSWEGCLQANGYYENYRVPLL
jgi:hypothetical protein